MTNVSGTVKFFNHDRGFGFIKAREVDEKDLFVHATMIENGPGKPVLPLMVPGARVTFDYATLYKDGEYKTEITTVFSVEAPPEPFTTIAVVKFYNGERNFGFVRYDVDGERHEAFLHGSVCAKSHFVPTEGETKCQKIVPGDGMPMRANILADWNGGAKVLSFEWGPAIEAEYSAELAELHAEDAAEAAGTTAQVESAAEASDKKIVTEVVESIDEPVHEARPAKKKPARKKAVKPVKKTRSGKDSAPPAEGSSTESVPSTAMAAAFAEAKPANKKKSNGAAANT